MKKAIQSKLAWIDHDSSARERSLQIIGLFKERDSRDELGLGAIRDSFSDTLFPGTSTLQTRLRYMLIVPWVFQALEDKRVPSHKFAARARREELRLIPALRASEGTSSGILGAEAGQALQRLPSAVYWSGLEEWRICRFDGSISNYYRSMDWVYSRRRHGWDHMDDGPTSLEATTWHPQLPSPPEGFPDELSFALTREEAGFLRDAIVTVAGESLLGWLAREGREAQVELPWEHPDRARFPEVIRSLLEHACLFSGVMQGAALLYNLMLAELDEHNKARAEEYREKITNWADSLEMGMVSSWEVMDLWGGVENSRRNITPGARRFVADWVQLVRERPHEIADNQAARRHVEIRERRLKLQRSRFVNTRLREQWKGDSGISRMTFRWPQAKRLINDLSEGLQGG